MPYYLNVTENGAGRIIFSDTNKDILGLAIAGKTYLSTCTAIIIVGDKGMTVIHDESYLQIESIDKEFYRVGRLVKWSIFYNSRFLRGDGLASRQMEMQELIDKYSETYVKGDKNLFCATSDAGKLLISRTKPENINIDLRDAEIDIREPKNLIHRIAIRHLNNVYGMWLGENRKSRRVVEIDIQFDGNEQTDTSKMICTYEQVEKALSVIGGCDLKDQMEYSSYVSRVFPNESRAKHEQTKNYAFTKLEESFKKTKENKDLIELIKLAFEAQKECRGEYECADYFQGKIEEYIELVLNCDDEDIKKQAWQLFGEEIDEPVDVSEDEHSTQSKLLSPSHRGETIADDADLVQARSTAPPQRLQFINEKNASSTVKGANDVTNFAIEYSTKYKKF